MTVQEMSDTFDVLYSNITSNQAPGLNEYEKSVFLTKAQKEIVKNYFTAQSKGNNLGQGFDDSAKRQADFSCLMKTATCDLASSPSLLNKTIYTFTYNNSSPTTTLDSSATVYAEYDGSPIDYQNNPVSESKYEINTVSVNPSNDTFVASASGFNLTFYGVLSKIYYVGPTQGLQDNSITVGHRTITSPIADRIDSRSGVWTFPNDAFIIINEAAYTSNGKILQVIPLRFDEYTRLMSKPFKYPVKNQAWRLINTGTVSGGVSPTKYVEVVSNIADTVDSYHVRYIRTPKPIILAPLGDLTIDGYVFGNDSTATPAQTSECELDPILHEDILQRAVELAKVAWTANGQENVQLVMQAGQRSE